MRHGEDFRLFGTDVASHVTDESARDYS